MPARAATRATRRVVVVLAPYLNWGDISTASMPNLTRLADGAILADVNVRASAVSGGFTPEQGVIVLSAGGTVLTAEGASGVYEATETVGGVSARDLYRQLFAGDPGPAAVLYTGQPLQAQTESANQDTSRVGALGTAAHALGAVTAAIGCSDLGWSNDPIRASRPAGVLAADESGRVDAGDVSRSMLVRDPTAPFGVRSSINAILTEFSDVIRDRPAALVVVDPGDLYRAGSIASQATTEAAAAARATALTDLDQVVGGLRERMGPSDVLMVIGPAVSAGPTGDGAILVLGSGGPGLGVSGSTHRDGLVTAGDVTDTILGLLGGSESAATGNAIARAASLANAAVAERADRLVRLNQTAVAVDSARSAVVNTYIVLAVLVLLAAAFVHYRKADLPRWAEPVARAAVLALMCVQLGSVLEFAIVRWPGSPGEVVGLMLGVAAVALALALLLGRHRRQLPLVLVLAAALATLLVDQWTGATLSFAQVFGYSPVLGARYYGLGNEMAGLMLGSVFMLCAVVLDQWRDAKWAQAVRQWGWPVIGAIVLFTAAAPFWGANVGPVAWMTVGFLVGWMLLNGRKVWTWRNLLILVVIVVIVVAALAVIDVSGGSGSETHLGRAVTGVATGGLGTLGQIIARKADANLRVLSKTNWTWLLVATLALLGYLRWRPRGEFAALLTHYPAFSATLAAALFAGVAAFFTEDSGIIIPALMFIPVGVTALYLMLIDPDGRPRPEAHAGGRE